MTSLIELLSIPVIRNALFVGFLMAVCACLLGITLVLRRFSMIGDGLSHVGFGAMAVAMLFNCAPLWIATPIVMAVSFLLMNTKNAKLRGDSAIAVASSASLAIGSIIASYTGAMNYEQYLFGSIFSLTDADASVSIVICVVILVIYFLLFHRIFCCTLDEEFSTACGIGGKWINYVIAALTALAVVIGMRMVGALLMSSFIVFPALSAMKLTKTYRSTALVSILTATVSFLFGFFSSLIWNLPIGASIVVANLIVFLLCMVISKLRISSFRI